MTWRWSKQRRSDKIVILCYLPVFAGFIWYFAAGQPRESLWILLLANTILIIVNIVLSDRRRWREQVAEYSHVNDARDSGDDESARPIQREGVGPSRPRP